MSKVELKCGSCCEAAARTWPLPHGIIPVRLKPSAEEKCCEDGPAKSCESQLLGLKEGTEAVHFLLYLVGCKSWAFPHCPWLPGLWCATFRSTPWAIARGPPRLQRLG